MLLKDEERISFMPGNFRDADVKCPFYKYIRGRAVFCDLEDLEGVHTVSLFFQTKKNFESYLTQRCCSDFKNCMLYLILSAYKYQEE